MAKLFGHVERMGRTVIPRRALELKFKGRGLMERPRTRLFSQVVEHMKKERECWQEIEEERILVEEEIRGFAEWNRKRC
jgi:hypothetical protein